MIHWQRLWCCLALLVAVGLSVGINQVQAGEVNSQADPGSKIHFDLGQLNDQGLQGPPGGLRARHYEFCIPAFADFEAQVKAIDPTIAVSAGSRGRIGCGPGEKLCLGHTHQPNFQAVLLRLAALPYVKEIRQCFFE